MALSLSITSFEENKSIPVKHTCEGEDVSPNLIWDGVPKGTVSQALLMEDPDAPGGTFTHWIMYNIPPKVSSLNNVPTQKTLDNGAMQGQNDFGKIGYGGPCPPHPEEHRYIFKLFALGKELKPEEGRDRAAFLESIKDHVIEKSEYVGLFKR